MVKAITFQALKLYLLLQNKLTRSEIHQYNKTTFFYLFLLLCKLFRTYKQKKIVLDNYVSKSFFILFKKNYKILGVRTF